MIGTLAIQEYIQDLIRANPADVERILKLPKQCDFIQWKYEHVKQFLIEINFLVVQLRESCTPETCQYMQVNKESYKCTTHKDWKECSAIDYMIHNLDNSTEIILKSKNMFNGVKGDKKENVNLQQIVRRLYRIMAHAMLYHENEFLEFEKEMFLYKRFYYFSVEFEFLKADEMMRPFV